MPAYGYRPIPSDALARRTPNLGRIPQSPRRGT